MQSGGLRALFVRTEPLPELCGLGPAKGCRLQAVLEVARRCLGNDLKRRSTLRSPRDTAAFLRTRMSDYPYEVFAAVFLDNRHRVIAFEEMFRGTIDGTAVHPREVVRACLRHNAAAVIFAHNHPSGVAEPSESDREITCELREALALVGVRVLDHFIVGTESPCRWRRRAGCESGRTTAATAEALRRRQTGPSDRWRRHGADIYCGPPGGGPGRT